jgi:hypothetical protein
MPINPEYCELNERLTCDNCGGSAHFSLIQYYAGKNWCWQCYDQIGADYEELTAEQSSEDKPQ